MDGEYLSWGMKHTGFRVPYVERERERDLTRIS